MTWATDRIFVAGGEFVSTQWPETQAQTGVSAVVTVGDDKPGEFADPRPWALLWLPVADESAYTLDHLKLGTQFIDAALQAERRVMLHAPKGVHRTRPLVAAHLLAAGKSLTRVLREIEQRPWLPPYQGSVALLEQFVSAALEAG